MYQKGWCGVNIIKTNFVYEKPLIPLDMNKVNYIILHHPDAVNATPQQIHQWHLDNGWSGAGYNEYVRKDGTVYILRGDNIGAQCQGFNSVSYGICAEGDYDTETNMPQAQFDALVQRIKYNKARFKNFKAIVPHNVFGNTSCPGKYFPTEKIINASEVIKMDQPHWADGIFKELNDNGITITDKRFDDKATRAEVLAMILQLYKALKK